MSDDELFDIYLEENEPILTSLRKIYNKGRADEREKIICELEDVLTSAYLHSDMYDYLKQLKEQEQ